MSRGATGRGPSGTRRVPARDRRSSAPLPRKSAPPEPAPPVRRTALTGRAAILALTLAFVIVAIALPFKIWLNQRGDITSLNQQIHQSEKRVAQLNAQDQQWNTPSYIQQQAEQRLHYVMPGQQSTIVMGPHKSHASKAVAEAIAHPAAPPVSDGPWYSQLWKSMQTAGGPTASGRS